jgi:hypothetical protein
VTVEARTQPRIDTLVTDAASGEQRRRTEYRGTAWIDGRAEPAGMVLRRVGAPGAVLPAKDVAFFLPDSLPYRRDAIEDAQLSVSAALQASGEQGVVLQATAAFVDDPSGAPAWVQLHISAFSGWPCAIAYTVVVLVTPDGVAG